MNVRLVPRTPPNRTVLYGGVSTVVSDGRTLWLRFRPKPPHYLPEHVFSRLTAVAEILLDDEPGDFD